MGSGWAGQRGVGSIDWLPKASTKQIYTRVHQNRIEYNKTGKLDEGRRDREKITENRCAFLVRGLLYSPLLYLLYVEFLSPYHFRFANRFSNSEGFGFDAIRND